MREAASSRRVDRLLLIADPELTLCAAAADSPRCACSQLVQAAMVGGFTHMGRIDETVPEFT